MHKKLITAWLAVIACSVFATAPSASAANLTESGVTIAVGASVTGTSTFVRFNNSNNSVTCTHVHMSGSVTADSNGTIAPEIPAGNPVFTGIGGGGDCESVGLGTTKPVVNSKLCFHIGNGTDVGTMTGCGSAVTLTLKVTNLGIECHYERASVAAEITTAPTDAAIKVVPGQLIKRHSSSIFCPVEYELEMELTLTTTDGSTLIFL